MQNEPNVNSYLPRLVATVVYPRATASALVTSITRACAGKQARPILHKRGH